MSASNAYLFVGGPWDGHRRHVKDGAACISVAHASYVPLDAKQAYVVEGIEEAVSIRTFTYSMRPRIVFSSVVYALTTLTDRDVADILLRNYQPVGAGDNDGSPLWQQEDRPQQWWNDVFGI